MAIKRSRFRTPGDLIGGWFYRFAASGWVPARWYQPRLPPERARAAKSGHLRLEIVSHCWQYGHLLVYQLSSLVKFAPTRATVTMTVYYSPADTATVKVLDWFGALKVPNVVWNWRPLPRTQLFRRAIGRNQAALGTEADWIWFTDCDLMFRDTCIDALADALQGRRDVLVHPHAEHCTPLLTSESPMLNLDLDCLHIADIDPPRFSERRRSRATGPLQIAHGDVARACGYCNALSYYQKPSETWRKAYEDRAFRWLLRTEGTPLAVPGVYRIRHVEKGRYTGSSTISSARSWIRRIESRLREFRHQ